MSPGSGAYRVAVTWPSVSRGPGCGASPRRVPGKRGGPAVNCRAEARGDTRGLRDEAPHPAIGSLKDPTNSQSVSAVTPLWSAIGLTPHQLGDLLAARASPVQEVGVNFTATAMSMLASGSGIYVWARVVDSAFPQRAGSIVADMLPLQRGNISSLPNAWIWSRLSSANSIVVVVTTALARLIDLLGHF